VTRVDDLAILGVAPSATDAEIRSAYRSQALNHHPDLGGDPRVMAEISDAYERLLEPAPAVTPATARAAIDPDDIPDDFTIRHSMIAFVVVPVILAVILLLGVFSVLSTIL
jgi:hypothetical protein